MPKVHEHKLEVLELSDGPKLKNDSRYVSKEWKKHTRVTNRIDEKRFSKLEKVNSIEKDKDRDDEIQVLNHKIERLSELVKSLDREYQRSSFENVKEYDFRILKQKIKLQDFDQTEKNNHLNQTLKAKIKGLENKNTELEKKINKLSSPETTNLNKSLKLRISDLENKNLKLEIRLNKNDEFDRNATKSLRALTRHKDNIAEVLEDTLAQQMEDDTLGSGNWKENIRKKLK